MATTALHLTGTTGMPWTFAPKTEAEAILGEETPSAFVVQAQSFFVRPSHIAQSSFGFTLLEHLYQRLRGLAPAGGF